MHGTGHSQAEPHASTIWVCIQVLKVETSPGLVETCHLTQVEQVASEESARLAAMHHVGPIHTFMFSNTGRLLMANKRGRERYVHLSESRPGCTKLMLLVPCRAFGELVTVPALRNCALHCCR